MPTIPFFINADPAVVWLLGYLYVSFMVISGLVAAYRGCVLANHARAQQRAREASFLALHGYGVKL